ncbi:MAG: hypothetical protein PHG00_05060 [Methylococcales bacterium]|nr:hypothetical protein [Methylococcales bacterium]
MQDHGHCSFFAMIWHHQQVRENICYETRLLAASGKITDYESLKQFIQSAFEEVAFCEMDD